MGRILCLLVALVAVDGSSFSSSSSTASSGETPNDLAGVRPAVMSSSSSSITTATTTTTATTSYDWLTTSHDALLLEQPHDQTRRDLELEDGTWCEIPIPFDSKVHKEVYTVGVLAIRGFEAAFAEFNATFNTYLTESAGQRFDPPIRFELKPLNFISLFEDAETQSVDYIYVNPSAYSCIESEYEAHSLVSQVSRRKVGGGVYDLKKFGGVIATLRNRTDIQGISDLKNKVIAAASISGLGSGQMQFKEMVDNGLSYLQDPKQLVFTSNQGKVVNGLLSGEFDVGFVRTDQIERSKDDDGNLVDLSQFKILEPKNGLEIDGVPFPFQSSTDLYAEWNIAGLTHVSPQVSREVQRAMLSIADYAKVGKALDDCIALNGTEVCNQINLADLYPEGPTQCSATHRKVTAAYKAQSNGKYAGWTTSLSYMQLRSMQEATGFISMEEDTKIWRCIRSAELYDAISCPAGYNVKTKAQVDSGCEEVGLTCKEGYQCVCRPCEAPYELVCVDSVKMGNKCISLGVFLPSIIFPVLILVGVLGHFYIRHQNRQADSVWVVKPKELEFESPPRIIGRGTFGLVLLGEYRGTQVAVKRVIPSTDNKGVRNTIFDMSKTTSCHNTSDDEDAARADDDDLEVGMRSMNQGMLSLAPIKLKRHLQEQAVKMADEVARKSENNFRRVKSFLWCEQVNNTDAQARLKADFVHEIRQLAHLRHPCITTVMGAVMPTRHDEPMLVMEYMKHGSLFDVLQDDSIVLKPEQILAILQDVAQGLRFLHSATPQVIHGDLKAQNVLIDSNFCAKVTDFGLSGKKQIGAVGTPYWMSPELLNGTEVNSAASDIYAYGMVMYEIYSGRTPYEGENYEEVVRQICSPDIQKRPPIPLHCPAKLAKLLSDCFEPDPSQRPTAEQLDMTLKVEMKVKERTSRLEALNKELEDANHKIASASAMQLQHFACMSHEIRTPLNCIIGLSSLLEETELNPMQQESMEMIVSSGKLLRQIVDDVLDCK
jgi:serine/threonine protein kinase/ABC-type phosphate/phosphonate transport system substrate-binding protein